MFLKCTALWHALSAAEQAEWESLARPRHMTGYAYWQSQCLRPNPGIYLPLQGGTMAGNITMDKHRLLKLPAPTDAQEAVNKEYADAITGESSWFHWRRGAFYHFSIPINADVAYVMEVNYLWAIPFYAAKAMTISDIGLRVTVGSAGAARLGVYEDDGSVYPGDLLLDAGTIDVTAPGLKSIGGLSTPFAANSLYWLVYVCDSTPSVKSIPASYSWALLGATLADITDTRSAYRVAFVYNPLPDPFPDAASAREYGYPVIGVKAP